MSVRRRAGIVRFRTLRDLLKSGRRAIAASLSAIACILSVAMLLSFPAARANLYGQHFGTAEIRQNIVRHTFVAGPEAGAVEKIAHIDAIPAISTPVAIETVAERFLPFAVVSDVPAFRLLQRVKLGSSRSGVPDPLL